MGQAQSRDTNGCGFLPCPVRKFFSVDRGLLAFGIPSQVSAAGRVDHFCRPGVCGGFDSIPYQGLLLIVGLHWGQLGEQYRHGIYAGLGTSLCYSAFLLSLRKLQRDAAELSFFLILMLVSFATSGVLGIEMLRSGDSFAIPDLQTLLSLMVLGLFSQCVGWLLISRALPRLRVSLSGLILLLQPALAFVWDVLFFSRPTSGLNWIGVAVVLGAIYMGTLGLKPGGDSDE
jgi:drug/metabolite transporter (DMT)-like permease